MDFEENSKEGLARPPPLLLCRRRVRLPGHGGAAGRPLAARRRWTTMSRRRNRRRNRRRTRTRTTSHHPSTGRGRGCGRPSASGVGLQALRQSRRKPESRDVCETRLAGLLFGRAGPQSGLQKGDRGAGAGALAPKYFQKRADISICLLCIQLLLV